MPIDLLKFSNQLEAQRGKFQQRTLERQNSLLAAVAAYRESDPFAWNEVATGTQADFNLAYLALPGETLVTHREIQPLDTPYTVVATDSSPMPPDRHGGMSFFHLINLGLVMLRYGPESDAMLESRPLVYIDLLDEEGGENKAARLIEVRSSVEELRSGLELAREYSANLVLRDGPLTLWTTAKDTGEGGERLRDEYFALLEELQGDGFPLVGYISSTHSQVVVNTLGVYLEQLPGESLTPAKGKKKAGHVETLAGLVDADLFRRLLKPGERGAIFKTALGRVPGEAHKQIVSTCFTYFHTPYSGEIARLEFPDWLLNEPERLEEVFGLVLNQYVAGQGYPVALMEAHEQAVLRGSDRELVREVLSQEGLLEEESEKGRSKRLRGI